MASIKSVSLAVGRGTKNAGLKVGSVTKNASVAVVNFDVHAPKFSAKQIKARRAARVAASQAVDPA